MRVCVIFNPVAKGNKARHFRRHLDLIGADCALKQTVAAGGARPLAAEAVVEGFDTIIAAGGDGTLNEALNGIGDVPGGFERVRLGVLPLGTVNVFAKEIGMPMGLARAWQALRAGRESRIDLPLAEYRLNGVIERRYFIQLAGSGLDARAVELVDWKLKKKIGPLAYAWAGVQAMRQAIPPITVSDGTRTLAGELVFIGNGRYYGGRYHFFPKADLADGLFDVCVFPKVNWFVASRCAGMLVSRCGPPGAITKSFQTSRLTLAAATSMPIQLDGENAGHLPATITLQRQALRIVRP